MIILAFLSGATLPDKASFAPLLFKRLTIRGTTLRSRAPEYQGELLGRFEKEALPMIVKGDMKVSVHDVYDWEKVADAHKEMEANKNSGKVGSAVLQGRWIEADCFFFCVIRLCWKSSRREVVVAILCCQYVPRFLWTWPHAGFTECARSRRYPA